MNPTPTLDPFAAKLVDALVDGELDDAQRADLLRRCEQSTDGWRTIALSFLEAQSWRQALASPSGVLASQPNPANASVRARPPSRTPVWLAALAVSTLLAFFLGRVGNGPRLELTEKHMGAAGPIVPSANVATANGTANADAHAAMAHAVTPAVRQQLERLGYRIQERPRVVSVKRSDGQTVQVLVNEVELRYVGRPFSL
jgi:hypothetical protein